MGTVLGDARMYEFTGGNPLSLDQLRERYRRLMVGHSEDGSQQWLNWVVRLAADDVAVGVMQTTVEADGSSAEIAWEVGVPWQGRGIASEAARAVVEWLIGQGMGTIKAYIHPEHHASGCVATGPGCQRRRSSSTVRLCGTGRPSNAPSPAPWPEDRGTNRVRARLSSRPWRPRRGGGTATTSRANPCSTNSRTSSGAIGPPCRRNVWTDASDRQAA